MKEEIDDDSEEMEETDDEDVEEEEVKPKKSSRGASQSNDDRQMWDATCSECGNTTKVPFEPDPNRPVFCKDCYFKKKKRRF